MYEKLKLLRFVLEGYNWDIVFIECCDVIYFFKTGSVINSWSQLQVIHLILPY